MVRPATRATAGQHRAGSCGPDTTDDGRRASRCSTEIDASLCADPHSTSANCYCAQRASASGGG